MLLDKGASVNVKDHAGDSLLILAVDRGNIPMIRFVLDKKADVHAVGSLGRTALERACSKGSIEVIALLLDYKADVNRKNEKDGGTVLMTASANGRTEVVKLLLDRGADPSLKDAAGRTAMNYAAIWGKADVLDLLKAHASAGKKESR